MTVKLSPEFSIPKMNADRSTISRHWKSTIVDCVIMCDIKISFVDTPIHNKIQINH
jgi:hypothetical protein